ncbi:MAG: hypothetical protein AAF211_22340 [Myxococcota bacterium]
MRLDLLFLAWLIACSDASLYGQGADDLSPDRVALTGRLCTSDARTPDFPVNVLFLVDRAAGPMFSTFDPQLSRLRALRETVALHSGSRRFRFAVAGFGPYARLLAPDEGWFTDDPGAIDSALATLGLPQGCVAGRCRDLEDGLETARAIIEADRIEQTAGENLRSRYIVVLVLGGPPDEGDDAALRDQRLTQQVAALRDDVESSGALGFALHTLFLAGLEPDAADPTVQHDATEALAETLSFVGTGRSERFDTADAITLERLGLLDLVSLLQAKGLLVNNVTALPGPRGPRRDHDRDGLADEEEQSLGTDRAARDTDGDGIGDLVELLVAMDPRVADEPPFPCLGLGPTPWPDLDVDLMNACEEALLGTDPSLPDTDGDAISDWHEVAWRTNYLAPDLLEDADGDGASNGEELQQHTDPVSSDATSHLSDAYRYDIVDEGFSPEASLSQPRFTGGVRVTGGGEDLAGGLGTLRFTLPAILSWQAPGDELEGVPVDVSGGGSFRLDSQGGRERWIAVDVSPNALPPNAVEEPLQVDLVERNCLAWTVRNVRLLPGDNDVVVSFAEAPAAEITRPGLFRLASIPVTYLPDERRRIPSAPVVEVAPEEFTSIGR